MNRPRGRAIVNDDGSRRFLSEDTYDLTRTRAIARIACGQSREKAIEAVVDEVANELHRKLKEDDRCG